MSMPLRQRLRKAHAPQGAALRAVEAFNMPLGGEIPQGSDPERGQRELVDFFSWRGVEAEIQRPLQEDAGGCGPGARARQEESQAR